MILYVKMPFHMWGVPKIRTSNFTCEKVRETQILYVKILDMKRPFLQVKFSNLNEITISL